jgi:hypothetical protein
VTRYLLDHAGKLIGSKTCRSPLTRVCAPGAAVVTANVDGFKRGLRLEDGELLG